MDNANKLLIHIHAQYEQHSSVSIVATRAALEALQKSLNKLIGSNRACFDTRVEDVETADGEQYNIIISMRPEDMIIENDKLPYTSDLWDGESV
ncbi:MAG: hypothetical protein WC761_01590 [Candidatus Paceibacterota bacterium]|jgi:hypothetical protein